MTLNFKIGMNCMFNLKQFGDKPAVIDENGECMTYEEMYMEGEKLRAAGSKGMRCIVFCLCTNSIASVMGYVSFLNAGMVPLLLNAHIEKQLLENLIHIYRPPFLWIPDNMAGDFHAYRPVYGSRGYSLVENGSHTPFPVHDELALLLTTSGSTGSPKFVRQSYKNIRSNTDSIIKYLKLDMSERPITTLPMNYTYGLSVINTHIAVGATILLTDKSLMQKEFWQFFRSQGATSFAGVPYTYEMLDKLRFYRMDLPTLHTMTQAGGKLTPELHEKFAGYATENGKNFIVMYGQCEATARMGYLPPEKAALKKGSMGIAIPGGRFELVDAAGVKISSPHVTGELVYYGENVTLGYAESGTDLTKGDERHGCLETGDMAQFDEDGYYYIVGRKKRFLKIYGNRVNLDEMERLIKGKFNTEAACAGVDDHMYIFLTDNSVRETVKDYVSQTTKLNPAAFKTVIIDNIPKNDSGKIKYTDLENYYDL